MPARKRNTEQEEGSPRRGSRARNTGFPVAPAFGVVALIALAVLGSQAINQPEPAPEPAPEEEKMFPDREDEAPPPPLSGRGGLANNAPPGLAESSSAFAAARALAVQGEQHLAAARAADASGDATKARGLRKQAHVAYNQAFEDTALWEMELEEKYSDRDRQVLSIKKERSRWMQKIIALHKTTGR